MEISTVAAEQALSEVAGAISVGIGVQSAIEALSAPVYVTDSEGIVTHFNTACISFAGRRPIAGQDRWCVTWKLYTTEGEYLPHDQCPMALAIRGKRPVRGLVAVAERPDGTRVTFVPLPTPIFSAGEFAGAVKMLIDVTDARQVDALREQARKCRQLIPFIGDLKTLDILRIMADEYEAKARELEKRPSR